MTDNKPPAADAAGIERTARCCCGQLAVTVTGLPILHGVCHCGNCQRRTGSAFGINAYFPNSQVLAVHGEVASYKIRDEQERFFCCECGTTLFWRSTSFPESLGIAGGCFTENPLPPPTLSVANEHAHPWVRLPGNWATQIDKPTFEA